MAERNQTPVTEFIFRGLTDDPNLQAPLFLLFLILYVLTVVNNIGISALIILASKLHSPMYFFLCILSMSDICYSSVVAPKMLKNLLSEKKSISFTGCVSQTFFVTMFSSCEGYLLSAMAYDRYAAICHPLLYPVIINRSICILLVTVPYLFSIITGAAFTGCAFLTSFCGSNLIDHFYCEAPTLMELSFSDTIIREIGLLILSIFLGLGSFLVTLTSYIYIISTIVKIPSNSRRLKTVSTCGSHLTALSLFYLTAIFCYLSLPNSGHMIQNKVMSVCYTVVIPMVNPLIYSLRNREVKGVMRKIIHKKSYS